MNLNVALLFLLLAGGIGGTAAVQAVQAVQAVFRRSADRRVGRAQDAVFHVDG